jgi:hypothetical protein
LPDNQILGQDVLRELSLHLERISMTLSYADIQNQLGPQAQSLLDHRCKTVPKERLHLPGSDWVDCNEPNHQVNSNTARQAFRFEKVFTDSACTQSGSLEFSSQRIVLFTTSSQPLLTSP